MFRVVEPKDAYETGEEIKLAVAEDYANYILWLVNPDGTKQEIEAAADGFTLAPPNAGVYKVLAVNADGRTVQEQSLTVEADVPPQTGDQSLLFVAVLGLAALACLPVVIGKKKEILN